MATTWTHVWSVTPRGLGLMEKEASNFDALQGDVTLRPVGGEASRQGWVRHSRPTVVQQWGTTPEEAIEKYLALQRAEIGNLEARIAVVQMQITHATMMKEML